jgi:hypothetical protein
MMGRDAIKPIPLKTVVRFGPRETCLMRIDDVVRHTGFYRYYGTGLMGETVSAGTSCVAVDMSGADGMLWRAYRENKD